MCDQAQLPSSHTHWKTTVPICNVFVSGYSAVDRQDSRTHGEIKAQQERFRAQNVPWAMQSVSSGCLLAFCCFLFLPPPPAPFSVQTCKASFTFQPKLPSFPGQFQIFQDILGGIWGQEAHLCFSPFPCFRCRALHLPFSLASAAGPLARVGQHIWRWSGRLKVLLSFPLSLWGSCLHLWLLGTGKIPEPVKASG